MAGAGLGMKEIRQVAQLFYIQLNYCKSGSIN
jgi:hypothetical protein